MAQSATPLRIGTRGSPLALVQARSVRDRLAAGLGRPADTIGARALAVACGKGVFPKEID
jgi:hydroxymethylbilane synthase